MMCDFPDGTVVRYGKLCLCTGARPNVLVDHPLVMGIRDTTVGAVTPLVVMRTRVWNVPDWV